MDTNEHWIIREITDVVATATELGDRRADGEPLPGHEQVALRRRTVRALRALAGRRTHATGVREALALAEHRLQLQLAATKAVGSLTRAKEAGPRP